MPTASSFRGGRLCRLLLPALVLVCAGCGRDPDPAPAPRPDPGQTHPDEQDVDRLRSLPYASYAAGPTSAPAGASMLDAARSSPGYNLYSIHEKCRAELIDAEGTLIRSWELQPSSSWSNCELLPDGDLIVVGWDASEADESGIGDDKRYVARFTFDGRLRWKRFLPAHHDFDLLPGGQILTLTFRRRSIPAIHPRVPVRDDRLTVLDDAGNPLRSLSFYDMASAAPAIFPLIPVKPKKLGGVPWIDLFHGNSVQLMRSAELEAKNPLFRRGNVLVCFRHQNRIAMVDPREGRILWAWGEGIISGPHDAQVLDDGHILLFDNGLGRGWSRVIEMDPASGAIVWTYKAATPGDFFSVSRGSCQRLPNGNTLIANSDNGEAFEVTSDGTVVWRFLCPHRNDEGHPATIVRLKRIEPAVIDALLATGGRPK